VRFLHTLAVFFVMVGGWVQAQPPIALEAGVYQFDELTAPDIDLTGDWVITSNVDGTDYPVDFLSSITGTSSLQFNVVDSSYITIYQAVWDHDLDDYTIQVDDTSYDISNDYPSSSIETISIPVSVSSSVTISRVGTAQIHLDYLTIQSAPQPTPTAEPYIIYDTISGVSGTTATRFDMSATAGDVAISSALIFLFFSLWSIFLILLIGKD